MDEPVFTERSIAGTLCTILSLWSIILCLVPFAWHLKNRNIPAVSLIFWIVLFNTFTFSNSLIWPGGDTSTWWDGAVYCDIQAKLFWTPNAGQAGALAAIMRNLAHVMNVNRSTLVPSKAQRRREVIVELLYCFAYPVFHIGTHYIVQTNRYYIFQIVGCTASWDWSWPTVVLVYIWPSIFYLIATFYTVLVLIRLCKYYRQFHAILDSSGSHFTKSRFIRLFILALILIVICLPANAFVFYQNMDHPMTSYSWSEVHGTDWWKIYMIPTNGVVRVDRWLSIISGFIVFLFFGLGKDALDMYRCWLVMVGFGRCSPSLKHPRGSQAFKDSQGSSSFSSLSRFKWRKDSNVSTMASTSSNCDMRHNSVSTQTAVSVSTLRSEKTFSATTTKDAKCPQDRHTEKSISSISDAQLSQPQSFPPSFQVESLHAQPRAWNDVEAWRPQVLTSIWGGNQPRDSGAPNGTVKVRVEMSQTAQGSSNGLP